MRALLGAPTNRMQGFLAASHVCTVNGYEEYEPIAAHYRVPIVVTGFEPLDILEGVFTCVCQLEQGRGEVGVPPRLAPVCKQAPPTPSCSLPGQACPDVREGSLFHADPGFRCMPFDKPRKL